MRTALAGTVATALAIAGSVYVLASPAAAAPPTGAVGTYTALAPSRILDTRSGNGAPKGVVGRNATVRLQVNGRGGVPASGVSAVVLNLTVVSTLGGGFLTAYPGGAARPTASSINFGTGATRANTVTVAVGASGIVDIFQSSAGTHILADVSGYYSSNAAAPVGSTYIPDPLGAWRLEDTRDTVGQVPGGSWYQYAFTLHDPAVDAAITAVALNVTAVRPTNGGYLTVWNGLGNPPAGVSAVNYGKGGVWPNSVITPASRCDIPPDCTGNEPMFGVYTSTTTHWLVDVFGYYFNDSIDGLKFAPITPQRILDTRTSSRLGPDTTRAVSVAAAVTPETWALSLNVTAVAPTTGTFLTVWPDFGGGDRPDVSNLNPNAGEVVSNGAITELGDNKQFLVYNSAGSINVVADMGGRFEFFPDETEGARAADGPPLLNRGQLVASNRGH
ncbi:hypothetical protein GCM10022251_32490 [Phytohabitans flavus]|uniref:Uncharacterized protein n=1 Tax=Phytohabitans flavus TaxID=1076124 RepID=A0A6F8XWM1_9ACTN|nr:hypothetical protein [Phytohabitans flavus]BCB78138.1 hypothetical protein Pflav_045480 [Phytohabitans flavus]